MNKTFHYGLDYDEFFKIIDNLYDEIWVYDNNYKIIYVNKACKRHYGLEAKEIIGKNFFDLRDDGWWSPSILPHVYAEKKLYAIKQTTLLGSELINIANPIFDEDGNLESVAMSVRDELEENRLFHPNYSEDDLLQVSTDSIVYESVVMKKVMSLAKKISKIDSTCLITGESGTGKTMLAKYIHEISPRKSNPFVSINCSSIPSELFESELFGYKKGAFTGAKAEGKTGLIESANGGTVLLDEIAEIPCNIQAKLLQVIQEKEFYPVGSISPQKVDIKVIAATNKDLYSLSNTGSFREDLFYRLNTFEIFMPPLRQREEDIEKLLFYFLNLYSNRYSMHHEISDSVVEILKNYSWKGNIRELSHLMERLVVTVDEIVIDKQHLPSVIFQYNLQNCNDSSLEQRSSYKEAMYKYEHRIVLDAYKKYKTTRKVAEALSISQTKTATLIRNHIHSAKE
ncbi:MAG: sigma 54-interacting transcriptional regulator [Tissierellales bacterium]|nr:sigma 54-interacting transcriptional regulator [Tissierellales bacterium]MBN2826910.1 sigma 54-interacting transcriptional regulator [Tissierellales bacterium]